MIAVVSPELQRGCASVKSAYNAASLNVHGIEPQYQAIRTIDIERGRMFRFTDEESALRVAIIGAEATTQLFGTRDSLGQTVYLNGVAVHGHRQDPEEGSGQQLQRSRQRQGVRAVLGDGARLSAHRRRGRRGVATSSSRRSRGCWRSCRDVLDSRTGRIEDIDWPLEREIRRVLAPRHRFDPTDRNAIAMWDTTLQTLMFGRMIEHMKEFFTIVGVVTLSLGGLGVMNIMLVAVRERTREIGVRKALGATTGNVQRQFFLEGFMLTMLSGAIGFAVALALCAAVNLLPMPTRFSGHDR